MSNTLVAQLFSSYAKVNLKTSPNPKAPLPVTCSLRLDNPTAEYSAGDTVSGTLKLITLRTFKARGILIAVDGTVGAGKLDRRGRTWRHDVTNLCIFTYVVKSNGFGRPMVFSSGRNEFLFSVKIPFATLPGTFESEHGAIRYRVAAFAHTLDYGSTYFERLAECPIVLDSYFNLNDLTTMGKLATQSWQTRKQELVSSLFLQGNVKLKSTCQESYLKIARKNTNSKIVLKIESSCYIPGEEIQFEIKGDRSECQRLVLALIARTIYTVTSATVVSKEITRAETRVAGLSSWSWSDKIYIPANLIIASSTTALHQPIIFQYFLRLDVERGVGAGPASSGELPIAIGTTREGQHRRKRLALDFDRCNYPVGITEMHMPEDWDRMYETGRLGYFETRNEGSEDRPENSDIHGATDRMRRLSLANNISSTRTPSLPTYSTLTLRCASLETLPPSYQEALENEAGSSD